MRRHTQSQREAASERVPSNVIDAARRGDEEAWAQLVGATHREIYTLCLRILRDPDDAAEATQDAYLKAWRGLAGFRGDAQIETWLYRVATNAALSKLRSRTRRKGRETDVGDEVLAQLPSAGSVEAIAAGRLDAHAIEESLATLPEHYRSAVVLRDIYGFSIEDIAKQLKISETAAKVRVHRGRKMLRQRLFAQEEER